MEPRHVAAATGALVAAGVAGWAWTARRRRGVSRLAGRIVSMGAASCALAVTGAVVAGGYAVQRRFNEHRYKDAGAPLAWVRQARHRRVGLAGVGDVNGLYPAFPSFGPRLGNEVRFVGPFKRGMLSEFSDRAAFVKALRRGHYDLLVVGHAGLPGVPTVDAEGWARSAGYVEAARGGGLVLLRAPGAAPL